MKRRISKQQVVKCEIDYEKLAELISHGKDINYDLLSSSIAEAIVKREAEDRNSYSAPREWMKYVLHAATDLMAIVFLIASVYLGYLLTITVNSFQNYKGFSLDLLISGGKAASYAGFMLLAFSLSISTFFLGKDIEQEKDRHFVAVMFSNVTSLVALIVALIALLRDVL